MERHVEKEFGVVEFMNVCFVTLYNDKYQPIFDFVEKPLREFCDYNNFKLEATKVDEPYEKLTFRKHHRVALLLPFYDWVVWCDTDILIKYPRFDFSTELGLYDSPIVISQDNCGMCAGFFAIKNTGLGEQFINTWAFLGEYESDKGVNFTNPLNGNEGDQHTFRCLYHSFPIVRNNVDYFPEYIVSNPNSSETDKLESFAHHYFGRWNTVDEVLKYMKETECVSA